MKKRGQVTLFIILGMILVILLFLGVYYKDEIFSLVGLSENIFYPSEVEKVKNSLDDCFLTTAKSNVFDLGYQGGYYNLPRESYKTGFLNVPYFLSYGDVLLVDSQKFNDELALAFENTYENCLDFNGLNVTSGNLDVDVLISENIISYSVNFPVKINFENNVYDLYKPYVFDLEIPFGYVYSAVSEFVESSQEDYIDIDSLLDKDFDSVDYFSPVDETYVFFILKETELGNYTYAFAMQYNFGVEPQVYQYYGDGFL